MIIIGYGTTYPMRRRAIMTERLPARRWLPIVAISTLVVVALIGNAVGIPREPAVGPVALAASWTLGCAAVIFILALNAFWERKDEPN
jgi:hypothetical protein